jgi:thiamine pyrophosphokinase
MRAVIFANGELPDPQGARDFLQTCDIVIAADGGTLHALALDVFPDVVVGDLDSLPLDQRRHLEASGCRIISFPARKDETDLELALHYATAEGATEIVVLAALGGRLDQTIANVMLLTMPELRRIDVRIIEGAQEAFLIENEATIEGKVGDTLSLIPLGGDAVGVTTEGLEWPLEEDTLHFGPARGVSNVLAASRAQVRLEDGLLLCIVIRGE